MLMQVQSTITSALSTGNISDTLNDIFTACAADSAEPQRRVVFETCITALNGERLQSQVAKDIIGKLLFEVATHHAHVTQQCQSFQHNIIRWMSWRGTVWLLWQNYSSKVWRRGITMPSGCSQNSCPLFLPRR